MKEEAMTMVKQIFKATQAAKDCEGTKKRIGGRSTYVVTSSDVDE